MKGSASFLRPSGTKYEATQGLICGIQIRVLTVFLVVDPRDQASSVLQVVLPSPFCAWLHHRCNHRGVHHRPQTCPAKRPLTVARQALSAFVPVTVRPRPNRLRDAHLFSSEPPVVQRFRTEFLQKVSPGAARNTTLSVARGTGCKDRSFGLHAGIALRETVSGHEPDTQLPGWLSRWPQLTNGGQLAQVPRVFGDHVRL